MISNSCNNYNNSYLLSSRPYLFGCEYGNIITINLFPKGPLRKIVRQVNFSNNRLSEFTELNEYGNKCGYALLSLRGTGGGYGSGRNNHRFMTANEIPDLFSFLISNGYKIDTSLTKMMNSSNIQIDTNNIIAFITYMQ
jgi:hypothetical protein